MKKKIFAFVGAIIVFSTLSLSSNKSEAAICHMDLRGVCCLDRYGSWACYCLPDNLYIPE
jgi:hypothetical protein